MTDLILRVEHVLRRSQQYYLRPCAWCDRIGGECRHHGDDLLSQARRRQRTLKRHPRTPCAPRFPTGRGDVAQPVGPRSMGSLENGARVA